MHRLPYPLLVRQRRNAPTAGRTRRRPCRREGTSRSASQPPRTPAGIPPGRHDSTAPDTGDCRRCVPSFVKAAAVRPLGPAISRAGARPASERCPFPTPGGYGSSRPARRPVRKAFRSSASTAPSRTRRVAGARPGGVRAMNPRSRAASEGTAATPAKSPSGYQNGAPRSSKRRHLQPGEGALQPVAERAP